MAKFKSWSNVEEIIVAEAILKQLREGSKQANVIKELSKKLDRSAKSIEMYWYKIKPKYQNAIDKIQGNLSIVKEEKAVYAEGSLFGSHFTTDNDEKPKNVQPSLVEQSLNIDSVISFLKENKEVFNNVKELEDLRKENAKLQLEINEVKKLKLEIKELKEEKEQLKEDYKAFANVMNKAREIFQDEKNKPRTVYKAHVNGTVDVGK